MGRQVITNREEEDEKRTQFAWVWPPNYDGGDADCRPERPRRAAACLPERSPVGGAVSLAGRAILASKARWWGIGEFFFSGIRRVTAEREVAGG